MIAQGGVIACLPPPCAGKLKGMVNLSLRSGAPGRSLFSSPARAAARSFGKRRRVIAVFEPRTGKSRHCLRAPCQRLCAWADSSIVFPPCRQAIRLNRSRRRCPPTEVYCSVRVARPPMSVFLPMLLSVVFGLLVKSPKHRRRFDQAFRLDSYR